MASANGNNGNLKNKLATRAENGLQGKRPDNLKAMLADVNVKRRFEEILGKKAAGFMSSMLTVTNGNDYLKAADPMTVISAGAIAAALDLPIDPNLGFAHIVPYSGKAQFQMGYKGYIQLAMRTGQYKTINACEVYEGEIEDIDRFTGEIKRGEKRSDKIVGYIAFFRLINGFEKYLYMNVEEIQRHGQKYSKSYGNSSSRWKQDFPAMAIKTVLKRLLSKYGILSIEMQTGLKADQAVINQDEEGNNSFEYPDGVTIDAEAEIIDTAYEEQAATSEGPTGEPPLFDGQEGN